MTISPASVADINGNSSSFQKVIENVMQIVELRNDQKRMMDLQNDREKKYCKLLHIRSQEAIIFLFFHNFVFVLLSICIFVLTTKCKI